ncbi:MAG: hypothetical protein INF43_01865 [Alphaproteobacteria bacterium]|jgi:hypothetical protein|nr:hypothetical protein [Alphaproteobacteria bacterium]
MLRLLACLVLVCVSSLAMAQTIPVPPIRPAELEPRHAERLMTRLALRYGMEVMPKLPLAERAEAEDLLLGLLAQVETQARFIPPWVLELPHPDVFLSVISLTDCGQFAAAIPSTRPPRISRIECLIEQQGSNRTVQPFYVIRQERTHVVGYVLHPQGIKRVMRVAVPNLPHTQETRR